ncbi:hypothetical protein K491DRAFT_697956 [Lophiostoma macrostomum CBS 122681]|uniref:Uncharacterized protein n=1 Tax=Lophiostoma macrostomum CBS 122681 TaxID=1314788 RepID=A0A6A6SPF8_9PLEO|nr:hypothetical protein K491DRAFT_697956 [Lophiostoma macrostomum CBS 122681]
MIRGLVKGIGSGIGLANEAIAHRKEKKQAKSRAGEDAPESDPEDDEVAWRLDEAAEAADHQEKQHLPAHSSPVQTPGSEGPPEYTVEALVDDFVAHHPGPPPAYSPPVGRLSAPVVLPQKRPRAKGRGFVRAYAPALEPCGIDQATFLDFLDTFDKSTHASQYLNAINVAANIVGMVPDPIIMAVTISIQVAVGTAKELQTRHRTNTYLDQMNDKLFRPHGLFCMLMTYKPGVHGNTDPIVTAGIIEKSITPASSKLKEQLKLLKLTSGTAKGEMELPDPAELVYPGLDEAIKKDENAFKSSSKFLADYYDRRAAATYAYQHPNSKLNVPQQKPFASRYSDPSHPANSGSISALLTGGNIDLTKGVRERKMARRDRRQQRRGYAPMTEEQKRMPRKGLIGRLLTENVLYLMVVNMPSQEEMQHAMILAQAQST